MKSLLLVFLMISSVQIFADQGDDKKKHDEQIPPNIVLIVAEDMSSRVGAFGDMIAKTPNIDALANSGIRYSNVFSVAGVCAPNRSGLITGVHPIAMGTQHMRTADRDYEAVPPEEVKAFPEILRRAGYVTANVAKTDYQFGEPFTVWDVNVGGYASELDASPWRKLPEGKPFFSMINIMSTHESRLATEASLGESRWNDMVKDIIDSRGKVVESVTDSEDVIVPPYYPDTTKVRESIALMYDNIHYMDKQVGQILQKLKEDGFDDNTIVIWTTDHGDGFPRAKRSIYDSGLKIPLAIRFPDGKKAGTIESKLVSMIDIAPTILGLAGVKAPDYIQGQNFLSKSDDRDYIYAARDRLDGVNDRVRAVRDDRYKYIRNYMPDEPYFRPLVFRDLFPIMQDLWKGHENQTLAPEQAFYFTAPRPKEELYDTLVDPYEVNNLASTKAQSENLARLRDEMDDWLGSITDRSEITEEEMIAEMWPGGEQPVTSVPQSSVDESGGGTVIVTLQSETNGASIGYRRTDGADERWQLYTGPLELEADTLLEAKAIRYGYAESPITRISADVR